MRIIFFTNIVVHKLMVDESSKTKSIHPTPIFASQVSDSLALIYPLADLVGFSKPSQ